MCAIYYIDDDMLDEISKVVKEVERKLRNKHLTGDIRPTNMAPVIVKTTGGLGVDEACFGYPGIKNKGSIFNGRAETVMEKRMFHNGIYNNRIVIPARRFYEWNSDKERNTFKRMDNDILYMAGFLDEFAGVRRFVILTTKANESMVKVHDRMPLIIEKNQVEDWIYDDGLTHKLLGQVPVLLNRKSDYEQQSLF